MFKDSDVQFSSTLRPIYSYYTRMTLINAHNCIRFKKIFLINDRPTRLFFNALPIRFQGSEFRELYIGDDLGRSQISVYKARSI